MKIVTPNPEINAKVFEVIQKELVYYTCQLFKYNVDRPEPYGSGVFVKLGESCYILTASHVAEYLNDSDETKVLLVRGKEKYSYINVPKTVRGTNNNDYGVDLAYIKLQDDFLNLIHPKYKFLPLSKFLGHTTLVDAAQYCVVGYPEQNTWISDGSLLTKSNGYVLEPCKERVYQHYGFNPQFTYLLEIKGKGMDLTDGSQNKTSDKFHGISGCGLWFLIINENNGEYEVDFFLIGIMTEFKKGKYYCMIGNRIDILLDAIRKFENFNYLINPLNLHNDVAFEII